MQVYDIIYSKEAVRVLATIPSKLAQTMQKKLQALAIDPYAKNANVRKLSGREGYRLRVGDWRIIYEIIDQQLVIEVVRIAARGSAYKE
jgi:mRNA interferase RelE/StbE